MSKYFFFGKVLKDDPKGHKYVTKSPDMHVEGGSKEDHDKATEIVQKFGEAVKRDGVENAEEILRDIVKKVKG